MKLYERERALQQWNGDAEQRVPPPRPVDAGSLVQALRNVLQSGEEEHHPIGDPIRKDGERQRKRDLNRLDEDVKEQRSAGTAIDTMEAAYKTRSANKDA